MAGFDDFRNEFDTWNSGGRKFIVQALKKCRTQISLWVSFPPR